MNRPVRFLMACAVAVSAAAVTVVATADEQQFTYPPSSSLADVQQYIDRVTPEHPRLMATAADFKALRDSIQTDTSANADTARRKLADTVVRQADLLLKTDPIKNEKEGRRLLGQSRRCLKRTSTLAMAYQLTGDRRYVDRCKQEMLAVARFTDWNPSHFLDVAEMTLALAVGYDWLYNQLDDASRLEIRTAIIEKGVSLPFETRHKGWVRASNNWGQVCHGGLTAGALAILEDEPQLAAKTVHNALQNVTVSMAAYAPNGSYPEGPGYWSYGTTYNVVLVDILEGVLGTDFGLTQAPGFSLTGQYPAVTTGPSGLTFNYADGGAGRSSMPALYWFAQRYDRPDWLLGESDEMASDLARIASSKSGEYGNRFLPMTLLWMVQSQGDDLSEATRMPLAWFSGSKTPVTLLRSSWSDPNATFVGLKAGSPSANHGQMDIGSFVLDADGVRWALDLGAEGYHGIESRGMNLWGRDQNSDRWKIFRQQNLGHNTLVINGKLQRSAGNGPMTEFSDNPEFPYSIVEMGPVYQGQADSILRGITLLKSGEVLIRDELTGLKPGSCVRWGMITLGEPVTQDDRAAMKLEQSDKTLELAILESGDATWQIIDTERPRNEWDSKNPGTRMVAFEAIAPDSGELTLTVLATPGSCTNSARAELKPSPLESWGK